ncbi:hypothetical protein THAOC_17622 [Thalassiosira oceanica]|uniref:Uncharacterized protein n=1 Tax=Thalassiosira oceanica TaxID=159749 RepID=K0SA52_THAOC|nr:hypothetical protein THAOC_17622 [Thalassiosira oceanica]|eukprot:EJK61819.1 hypothetical protein THAOC_17622 [Thalassiosira oceanica]
MEANASTTSSVDAKPSPMAKPITTAGPAMPSSIAEPTPAAGPTVPSPPVETTPESGPAVPSSIAEPTPVAEPAAEAPSSLAEPMPPPTAPVVGPDHTPGDGTNWPTPAEASLGPFVRDDAASLPMTDETARPSAMPSRPGVKRSPGDPAGPADTEVVADVLPSIGEAGPFSSWDTEGLGHSIRFYDTEDDGLYTPRVRHRRQMKRDDSTLDCGRRRLYSLRHRKTDSENTARRESRYEAPTAGIAAAAPSPTELMSADGANACTASTAFDGLDQAPPQVEALTAGSADAALLPTAALPTVEPDADTVPLWASAPDSDSTGFRDGWTSRVSCSRRGGKTNAASTSVADPAHTNKDHHTGRTLKEAYLGSKVQDGAAPMTLTGGTAGRESMDVVGHVNTIDAGDSDWVIVEHKELPTLPSYPGGAIDFIRLDLDHVELVPHEAWMQFYFYSQHYEGGVEGRLAHDANMASRHAKLTRFLERQLRADRILALSECDFWLLCDDVGLEPGCLCYDKTQDARARGLTRTWERDWENDCYFLRDKEQEEVKEKYDRGGNESYPRTGRDHKWCKKKHCGRHISLTAGDRVGKVRGETHNADTDFEARTHVSLDKRALRRNQGGRHRHPTDHSGRKRGRGGSYTGPSQFTPGLMVVPFHPDEIGIPDTDDDVILVQGQFHIPRSDIVSFLGKKHHFVYSKDREVPVNVSVERSRVDEPVNAGLVTTASSSLAESTPSSTMAEPTCESGAYDVPITEEGTKKVAILGQSLGSLPMEDPSKIASAG